jgi:hypothetical protein
MKDQNRTGNFSSSGISALMKNGKGAGSLGVPFYTYVNEKRREKRAGRSVSNQARATPTDWGNMCEKIAHDYLPLDYKLVSNDDRLYYRNEVEEGIFEHLPWCGVPDGYKDEDTVTDIKCMWTLTSFFNILEAVEGVAPELIGENLKKECPEYYWQLISNAILSGRTKCELILFMPKKSMIDEIKLVSLESEKYYFHTKTEDEMPWTSDESDIPVITIIKFDASDEDKAALTERVNEATKLLNK